MRKKPRALLLLLASVIPASAGSQWTRENAIKWHAGKHAHVGSIFEETGLDWKLTGGNWFSRRTSRRFRRSCLTAGETARFRTAALFRGSRHILEYPPCPAALCGLHVTEDAPRIAEAT